MHVNDVGMKTAEQLLGQADTLRENADRERDRDEVLAFLCRILADAVETVAAIRQSKSAGRLH